MKSTEDNKVLKWMTFVTSSGDHLTFFAILVITQKLFKNVWVSSYNIAIQALAIAVGCFLVPKLLNGFKIRSVFLFTQIVSMLTVLALYVGLKLSLIHSPLILYLALFIVTVLWQVFYAARESLSKSQAKENSSHRSLQAELLEGFYSAQVFGPLIALLLILKFDTLIPLLIDAASFGVCAVMSFFIKSNITLERKVSIFHPFTYFSKKPLLKKIFLLRTFGFWIPISVFNLIYFPLAQGKFKNILPEGYEILGSTLIYAILGFGATLGNIVLRKRWLNSHNYGDGFIASICQTTMAITMFAIAISGSLGLILILLLVNGIAMGTNALTTQTIRRKLTTNEEFVEVVSLEPIVGRGTDWLVASFCVLLPQSTWQVQLALAAFVLLFVAHRHSQFDI